PQIRPRNHFQPVCISQTGPREICECQLVAGLEANGRACPGGNSRPCSATQVLPHLKARGLIACLRSYFTARVTIFGLSPATVTLTGTASPADASGGTRTLI